MIERRVTECSEKERTVPIYMGTGKNDGLFFYGRIITCVNNEKYRLSWRADKTNIIGSMPSSF